MERIAKTIPWYAFAGFQVGENYSVTEVGENGGVKEFCGKWGKKGKIGYMEKILSTIMKVDSLRVYLHDRDFVKIETPQYAVEVSTIFFTWQCRYFHHHYLFALKQHDK